MLITKVVCPSNKISIKCPYEMTPEYISVHNTANDASAMAEISYMLGNPYEVSFHFAVDDYRAVQGLDENRNGWHAGDGGNGTGNRKSIGIEICYSKSGGDKFTKAENNAVELIVHLLKKYGWGIDRVKKHQDWSNKRCPHRTLDLGWSRFLKMIENKLNESTSNQNTVSKNNEVNIYYRAKTKENGWLPEVKNLEDYAGYKNNKIIGLAMKVDKGSIKYRVTTVSGKQLGWITGCNINDYIKGWAGNGEAIALVEVFYYTPNNIRPYKKAKYKVNNYGWQYDTEKSNNQDGYAGVKGVSVTKFRICID